MYDSFICLNGVISAVTNISTNTLKIQEGYLSKWKCCVHENCFAVPCVWPVGQIKSDWSKKETCISALLVEATTCFKCPEKAVFLCVYGGHMVCQNHVEVWTLECRGTKSPFQCGCVEGKGSPAWPNPFSHYYLPQNAIILEQGDTVANFSYLDFNFKFFIGVKVVVISWQYADDMFPNSETFDSSVHQKRMIKWRLGIVCKNKNALSVIAGNQNSRCYQFWKHSPVNVCHSRLKIANQGIVENVQELFVHTSQLFGFLFLPSRNQIMCINCKHVYDTKTFATSPCSIFTFEELKMNTRSCTNYFGNLIEC